MKQCQNCKHKELSEHELPCKDCEYINDTDMSHWEPRPPECDPAETKIADSGERKEFPTGAKRDIQEGKGRCDLLPLDVVYYMSVFGKSGEKIMVLNAIHEFVRTHDTVFLVNAFSQFINERGWDGSTALLELSVHFEDGAKKYGEYNWQKGIPVHSYIDSAVRHYLKYLRGDTDERHDRAFCWNIVCCIWTMMHKPEMNDLPKVGDETWNRSATS